MKKFKGVSRLTFLYKTTCDKYYNWRAMYKCACGTVKEIQMSGVRSGGVVSCGCYTKERLTRHSRSGEPLLNVWYRMKAMCYNPKHKSYKYYGGRGITICETWLNNPGIFIDWCKKNGWKSHLEIDRRNNDGNYEPGNCRFVTRKVNCNNMSSNVIITYNGKTQNIEAWARELGMDHYTLYRRIWNKWPLEKAFTKPIKKRIRN